MKRNLKKGTALLLTGTIFMSTLSTTAFAAEPAKNKRYPHLYHCQHRKIIQTIFRCLLMI